MRVSRSSGRSEASASLPMEPQVQAETQGDDTMDVTTSLMVSSVDCRWGRQHTGDEQHDPDLPQLFAGPVVHEVERFVRQQPEEADEVLFNALLDTHCRMKDIAGLEATFSTMRELNIEPSHVTLGILVKAYGQACDIKSVLRLWDEMVEQRQQANAVTYGCMINACVRCGQTEKAVEIFSEMKKLKKHCNTILYTTLIKGYGNEKDLQSALGLFREMKEENVPYNTIAYNSIIDVCIKCSDVQAAEDIFREMLLPHSNVQPDLITYSTLLKGYCQVGNLDKALQVAETIKACGLKCDELVYNTLMDGCVKANDLSAGVGLFAEMMQSGMKPSSITHSIFLRLYQRNGYKGNASDAVAQLYQVRFGDGRGNETGDLLQAFATRVESALLGVEQAAARAKGSSLASAREASLVAGRLVQLPLGETASAALLGASVELAKAARLLVEHARTVWGLRDLLVELSSVYPQIRGQMPTFRFHPALYGRHWDVLEWLMHSLVAGPGRRVSEEEARSESPLRMVELGVACGPIGFHLLPRFPSLRYFGADPTIPPEVWEAYSLYADRATLYAKTSEDLHDILKGSEPLDLVFIDGPHTYKNVRNDLEMWAPRMRPGGIIAGHDFTCAHPPLLWAVTEFRINEGGGPINLAMDGVWWWRAE